MIELKRIDDPIFLQVLCDALDERGIRFRVDNAGMHALMPLPVVMDARLLVEEAQLTEAEEVLRDLESEA